MQYMLFEQRLWIAMRCLVLECVGMPSEEARIAATSSMSEWAFIPKEVYKAEYVPDLPSHVRSRYPEWSSAFIRTFKVWALAGRP